MCCFTEVQKLPNGDLFEFLRKYGPLTDEVSRRLFKEILIALEHMHNKGYAHRDLKLENIMLDENYRAVIIDLDFAKRLKGN